MNTSDSVNDFRRTLETMDRGAIIAGLLEMARKDPGFADTFLTVAGQQPEPAGDSLKTNDTALPPQKSNPKEIAKLEKKLRRKIDATLSSNGIYYWSGPDFSDCAALAEELVNKGGYDAVLRIAEHFVSDCDSAFEGTSVEMPMTDRLVGFFVEALKNSSMREVDKLLWAMGQCKGGWVEIFHPYRDYLKEAHSADAWNEIAGILLGEAEQAGNAPDDTWILHAIDRCEGSAKKERKKQADALRQKHAQAQIAQGNYNYAIRYHMDSGGNRTALSLTEQALHDPNCRNSKTSLLAYKCTLYAAEKDEDGELLSIAEAFVNGHGQGVGNYCSMRELSSLAAKAEGCFIDYLEKGVLPWENPAWPGAKRTSTILRRREISHGLRASLLCLGTQR